MFGRKKGATYKVAVDQEMRRGSLGEGEVLGKFKRTGSLAQNDAPALNLLHTRNTKNKEHYFEERGGSEDEMEEKKNVGNRLKADMKELSASFTDLRFFKPRKSEGDIFPGGKPPRLIQHLRAKSEEASPSSLDDEEVDSFIDQVKSKIRRNSHIKEEEVIEDIFGFLQHVDEETDKKPPEPGSLNEMYTRTGYLFFLEHKGHGRTWQKCYCRYDRVNSLFCIIPYHQTRGTITHAQTFRIKSCHRKHSVQQENCFCFDIISDDSNCWTLRAESEDECRGWVNAISLEEYSLEFVKLIILALEERGLEEVGIYRTCGVKSKWIRVIKCAVERQDVHTLQLEKEETKTLTSVLKEYCRHFPGSLLTQQLKTRFIDAAKIPSIQQRIEKIGDLLYELPTHNQSIINAIFTHLRKVATMSEINRMTSFNLSTVWGPNLLSSRDEAQDLLHIKDNNEIAHILIENWEKYGQSYPWQRRVSLSPPDSSFPSSSPSSSVEAAEGWLPPRIPSSNHS